MVSLSFGKKFPQPPNQVQRCNVLVIGNTGAGKTTLIHTLFKTSKAEVEDVTKNISNKPFSKVGTPVTAYDTPGLEKDKKQRNKVKQDITRLIKQKNQKEPDEQIHAIWYCVNSQVNREDQIEREWIDSLAKELPIIAVITRAYGAEEDWLKLYLEGIPTIKQVVPIMAQEEKVRHNPVGPYGLDCLLSATGNLRREIVQKAITNSVNAKSSQALIRCIEGCSQILFSQAMPILTAHLVPASLATPVIQFSMLSNISKVFGCQITEGELRQLIGSGVTVAGGFNVLLEGGLKNLLSTNPNNIQTVKDFLLQFSDLLDHTTEMLPFKEQVVEILTNLSSRSSLNFVCNLPVLNCITAITTLLETLLLGIAYMETMKEFKKAEYEGRPISMVKLKEIFAGKFRKLSQLILDFTRQFLGQNWIPGVSS